MASVPEAIGGHVAGYSVRHGRTQVYRCVGADVRDVTVVNILDTQDVRRLSPHAIGRTFQPAERLEDGRWKAQGWGILKEAIEA